MKTSEERIKDEFPIPRSLLKLMEDSQGVIFSRLAPYEEKEELLRRIFEQAYYSGLQNGMSYVTKELGHALKGNQ